MHIVGLRQPRIPNGGWKILFSISGRLSPLIQSGCIFIEKTPHISGPVQFKPMLFKNQDFQAIDNKHVVEFLT